MKFSISMRGVSSSMQLRSGKVTASAGRDVKVYNFLLLLCVSVTSSTGGVTSLQYSIAMWDPYCMLYAIMASALLY